MRSAGSETSRKPLRWKRPKKVNDWLLKAAARWGTPVRVYVHGQLMAQVTD